MTQTKPKIIYKTVTINKNNVDNILSARHGGYYNAKTNVIVLFQYDVANDIPNSKAAAVSFFINQVREYHDKIIFHEMQHWYNRDLVSFSNYYQQTFSYCLNEVSAITAEIVYTDPEYKSRGVRQVPVACSMMQASYIFLHFKFDKYVNRFVRNILSDRTFDTNAMSVAQLRELQNVRKNNPEKLFDKNFYNATNSFFTYNGYSIFDDKIYEYAKDVWNDTNNNLELIKQKCIEKTSNMIDAIIRDAKTK